MAGQLVLPCRIGRNGITHAKREGDGGSPAGSFRIRQGWWRNDRRNRPVTGIAVQPLHANHGWCDAPGHRLYNRLILRPFSASHEEMWRDDRQYDLVFDIDWNRHPRRQGRGSAIFLHQTSETGGGTAGCVAVDPRMIERLLVRIGPRTRLVIG